MKKIFLLLLSVFFVISAEAQKGSSQFALFAGYEHFPEMWVGKGYNVGVEYKYYVHNRFFAVANFHAGVNDASEFVEYEFSGNMLGYTVGKSTHDYMIGLGLGGDLLHLSRHKIYIQGTVGLGTSEMSKDGVSGAPGSEIIRTHVESATRFAVSASAGYDYRICSWLAVGVNYTGWQIGYEYKNSANVKLSLLF